MSDLRNDADISETDNVRACRACLALDCKLYDMREKQVDQLYSDVTGLQVSGGHLCNICLHMVFKFKAFRTRCRYSDHILNKLLPKNKNALDTVDRKNIKMLSRSRIWSVKCKSTRELFITDTLHVDVPADDDTDFEDYYKQENSLEQIENYSNLFNSHDHMDNIEFYDEEMATDIDEINYINEFNDAVENEFENEVVEIKENYTEYVIDNTETNKYDAGSDMETYKNDIKLVIETNISDTDLNVDESDRVLVAKRKNTWETNQVTGKRKKDSRTVTVRKHKFELFNYLRDIWDAVKKENGDYYQMFERLYKFSLNKDKQTDEDCDEDSKKELVSFSKLLELYKKVADFYNVDITFISILIERKEMDEKRKMLPEDSKFTCRLCCKIHYTDNCLERHMKHVHIETHPYRCEVCLYTFKKEAFFIVHLLKFHCMTETCRDCNRVIVPICQTKHWAEVMTHYDQHHRAPITCEFCGRSFSATKNYHKHVRTMHGREDSNTVLCWLCGGSFNGPQGLRMHVVAIHAKAVRCATCGVYFQHKEALTMHLTDNGECQKDLSACPLCGAIFQNETSMKTHYDKAHAKYTCEMCDRTFIEYSKYKVHTERICVTSDAEAAAKVKAGKKKIKDEFPLSGPVQAKRERKPSNQLFVCSVCGKDFNIRANLLYHMRIHTGEKPYKCEFCEKSFRIVGLLQKHVWTHTGERRYKCEYCPKSFRQQQHLTAHMPSHTNEKRYGCELCKKRYTARRTLKDHVMSVHQGLPLPPKKKKKKQPARNDN